MDFETTYITELPSEIPLSLIIQKYNSNFK